MSLLVVPARNSVRDTRKKNPAVDCRLISAHSLHMRCHVNSVPFRAGAPVVSLGAFGVRLLHECPLAVNGERRFAKKNHHGWSNLSPYANPKAWICASRPTVRS